jgi:ABC-type transport system involved in multi-copper enzyme maturation, permease component
MKVIIKVARTELNTLFFSPIAWFLLIVFWIQCGTTFFSLMEYVTRQIEMSGDKKEFYSSVADSVFLGTQGLFRKVMDNLYLYIPLLTMSLISREISSGTMKLLYSSPVSMYEIVLGKFVAMMLYNLLLVLVVGVYMACGMMNIPRADTGMLLTALFGFYLLLCAYSAIGLFMSALTSYQVVAAVSTFVAIGVFSYIGTLWQDVDIVRELTYFLSINGRTQKMLAGLITSKDVLYFTIIVYMFLSLTIYKLKAGMESGSRMGKAMRYVAIVASALLVGYVSSIPRLVGYWDTTYNKSRTLTPQVQKIIKDLGDDTLEVTAYANILDRYFYLGAPTSFNSNKARWESYMRFKDNIVLNKVVYYDTVHTIDLKRRFPGKTVKQVAEHYAKVMNMDMKEILSPQEIKKKIDLSEEMNRYVMKLKWKDRTTFLRVFDDITIWPSETEVAAALLRLQQATLPKIAFVNSELEREINKSGDHDYKVLTNTPPFRHSLVNQGFDVVRVSLESDTIPAGISALVLADPRVRFSDTAMAKLRLYIHNGGNMLIAGEPGRQSVLNPLLKELGVWLEEGMVIQESADNAPNFVTAYIQKEVGRFYKPVSRLINDSVKLNMPGATSIGYQKNGLFSVTPLVVTHPGKSWHRFQPINLETSIRASVTRQGVSGGHMAHYASNRGHSSTAPSKRNDSLATVTFNPEEGDVMGPLTTMVALSRTVTGKEQRIVVSGDADFLSNKELNRTQRTANFLLGTSLFRWVSGGAFPIETSRPEARDKKVKASLDALKVQRTLFLWAAPVVMLLVGVVVLIRRKRK